MKKRKPINFKGAGLFLFAKNEEGILYILLGKRKNSPYKGVFTVATGQSLHTEDKGKHGFFIRNYTEIKRETALREAKEEIVLLSPFAWPNSGELRSLFSVNVWFYDWENFFYLIPGNSLPKVEVGEHEVEAWNWYPTNALPDPLFPGIPLLSPPFTKLIERAKFLIGQSLET